MSTKSSEAAEKIVRYFYGIPSHVPIFNRPPPTPERYSEIRRIIATTFCEQGSGVLAAEARTESAVQPKPGGAPVDTAVQAKTESSGLSVGERCAEKMVYCKMLHAFIKPSDVADLINLEVNADKDK